MDHRLKVFERTFGHEVVKNITTEAIKRWLVDDATRSEQTKLNFKRVLHGFFSFAMKHKYAALNPAKDIEIRVESDEPGILTVAQAQCLLFTALENPQLGLGPFATLGLFCGVRSEELSRLNWRDMNFSEGFVTIPKRIVVHAVTTLRLKRAALRRSSRSAVIPGFPRTEPVRSPLSFRAFHTKTRCLSESKRSDSFERTQTADATAL